MSGTEKILASLKRDCDMECESIIKDANAEAEEIISRSKEEASKKSNEIILSSKNKASEILRLAESSQKMKERQNLLSKKVNLLNKVLNDALAELNSLEGPEYYEILKNLALNNAQKGEGVLVVSEKDKKSVPKNFCDDINKSLPGDKKLVLKSRPDFNGKGVILVYGDVEINLTFKAIFESSSDDLKALAGSILFS